jgi:glutamate-1-semialdehyde 2,1-aminomutase
MSSRRRSEELFERARKRIPGGVNSPVRAFKGVGGTPIFIARGEGCRVWDADGNESIDYLSSWGPLIAGHANDEIIDAVAIAAGDGTSFGAPTEREVIFAEQIHDIVPSMEKLRLVSSGTEATMSALRLARGATGRDKIIKIDGGYHGHSDYLLVSAGSGAATLGIPGSGGVTKGSAADTLTVPWNDLESVRAILEREPIAALIVEPVCGNIGCVPPKDGYLAGLRALTKEHGALLIFDEVITGFRVAYGGAQERFGVTPDLTCLGKIIGGGLPVGAYGGRADLMAHIAPDGPVYQAGTLSGNPLAVAAGMKMLEILGRPGTYEKLDALAKRLVEGMAACAREASVPLTSNRVGSMFTGFFTATPVTDYASAKTCDTARYAKWFHAMLDGGVHFAPSQFECGFVSLAHDDRALDKTLEAARKAFFALRA